MQDAMTDSLKRYDSHTERLMFYGFCGFFFFIPVATSPAVITGLFTLSVWIFSGKFVRDREWLNKKWTLPVIIFMLLPWAGLLYTEDLTTGLDLAKKSYYWLYAFAIASQFLRHRAKTFINFFLMGLSLTVCISLFQYIGFVPSPKGFATGFIGGASPYITYSLLLVFGMLILSYYCRTAATRKRKALLLLLICAFFLSLAVVPGRIGYLAFAALSPLMLYNILGRRRLLGVVALSVFAIALLISSSVVRDRIWLAVDEVRDYQHGEKASSVGARLWMWDGAVNIFLENPIIGVGTGGYKNAMMKYKDDPSLQDPDQPHNSFLYLAASYGVVGLAAFLWLIIVFLRKGWQARHGIAGYSVLAFGLVLLIGGLTDTQFLSLPTGEMFALLMGLETGEA
jgi:O-antigen ligase